MKTPEQPQIGLKSAVSAARSERLRRLFRRLYHVCAFLFVIGLFAKLVWLWVLAGLWRTEAWANVVVPVALLISAFPIYHLEKNLTLRHAIGLVFLFCMVGASWIIDETPWSFWQRNERHAQPPFEQAASDVSVSLQHAEQEVIDARHRRWEAYLRYLDAEKEVNLSIMRYQEIMDELSAGGFGVPETVLVSIIAIGLLLIPALTLSLGVVLMYRFWGDGVLDLPLGKNIFHPLLDLRQSEADA